MNIGQRIKIALENSGASPEEVKRACGLKSVQAVYAWLRGDVKNIRLHNLFALADLTGYEARWLATEEGPQRRMEDKQKEALNALYDKADDRGKRAIFGTAERESSYMTVDDEPSGRAA